MLLTPEQLQEIKQIVEDHHAAFVANTIGPEAVPPAVLQRLRELGLVDVKVESIRDAYLYGQLLATAQSPQVANMSFAQFKAHLRRNPIPLSAAEHHAVQMAQLNAGQYALGLGNRGSIATGDLMIEADATLRARTEGIIRDATALNIARRETTQQLRSDLGWATGEWKRDWHRIANTEKQNAMQHGVADGYRKEHGPDALVARRRMPDSCKHCARLYEGADGQPKIFKLRDLEANGTNVGRKAADWLPVSGVTHPSCQCQTIHIPQGFGFDEEGRLVPGGTLGEQDGEEPELARARRLVNDLQKAIRVRARLNFRGLPIDIENPAGSIRTWADGQGGTGETEMLVGYGFIRQTNGTDEDEIDVFVGPDPKAEMVYVIEQQAPKTGVYDESKAMVGFSNQEMAEQVYQAHFDRPDFRLYTTAMTLDQFKRWIQETAPTKGEMMKASDSQLRLVIPLSKARVPAYIGAAESQAGNRSPSQYGTGPNYIFRDTPPRPQPAGLHDVGYSPDSRELAEHFYQDFEAENPLKRDRAVYEFPESERIVRPLELPTEFDEAQEMSREGHKDRMRYLLTERIRNAPRPKNKVDIEEGVPDDDDEGEGIQKGGKDRAPTLTKQGQFTVIEIGPRGGKIIGYQAGKAIYLHKLTGRQQAALKQTAKKQVGKKEAPERKPVPKPDGARIDRALAEQQSGKKTPPKDPPEAYTPDPAPKPGQVADAARVGIPGKAVMPPPKIPRLPNLTPEERALETKFIEAFEADPDGMAKTFYDKAASGNFIFETDAAKELMPEWVRPDLPPDEKGKPTHPERAKARAMFNTVLHQVANAIAKRAFMLRLDEIAKMPKGKREILVTSGGVAGGKGSALKARPDLAASVAATWDAAGEQNATENPWLLEECEKRGIKPTFLFVAADPAVTWTGAIARAKSIGRMVDARVFADSYAHGAKNFNAFYQQNKGKVSFVIAQAGTWGPPPTPAQMLDEIPKAALALDANELYKKSMAVIAAQKSELPPHVVSGATVGARIWSGKTRT